MFEYLMPLLVMRTYPRTLLDETYHAVVSGRSSTASSGACRGASRSPPTTRRISRGITNTARSAFRVSASSAGWPTIWSSRPTPSSRAARARRSHRESRASARRGAAGRYGYYEAIDYTPERLHQARRRAIVLPTYMAHHQGMSLVALDNLLNGSPCRSGFTRIPAVQAAELLLQERIPHLVPLKIRPPEEHKSRTRRAVRFIRAPLRHAAHAHARAHLLSNGS